jgi:hypothetical protein
MGMAQDNQHEGELPDSPYRRLACLLSVNRYRFKSSPRLTSLREGAALLPNSRGSK